MGQEIENIESCYDVLGINPYASDADIKKAYRTMAMRFHPDHNPQNRRLSELRFKIINEAYSQLKTKEKRNEYNRRMNIQAGNDNSIKMPPSWLSHLAAFLKPTTNKTQNN